MVELTGEWEKGYLRPLYRGLILEQDGHQWSIEDWIAEQLPEYDLARGNQLGPVKITITCTPEVDDDVDPKEYDPNDDL